MNRLIIFIALEGFIEILMNFSSASTDINYTLTAETGKFSKNLI